MAMKKTMINYEVSAEMTMKKTFETIEEIITDDGLWLRKWVDDEGDTHVDLLGEGYATSDIFGDWQPTDEVWEVTPPKQWFDKEKVRANLQRELEQLKVQDPHAPQLARSDIHLTPSGDYRIVWSIPTVQDRINEINLILANLDNE